MKSNYPTEKFYLHFCELGSYDDLEYWFKTKKQAIARLKELEKQHKEYFGFIAEVKISRRKPKPEAKE